MKKPILVRQFGCLLVAILYAIGFLALIAVVVSSFCGCTTTKYVPVETVRTEYKDVDTTAIYNHLKSIFESKRENTSRIDSLVDRTKETVVLNVQGDTVRLTRTHYVYVSTNREKELETKVKEQDSTINDLRMQLTSVKADSIQVPYPVEKPLTKWQQTKMDFGGIAMGGLFAAVAIAVVWLIRRFRK